jgi:excisionase family DNA binding protein
MWEDPGRDTRQRLSVAEAADALGLTVDAVRSRIKRGTIDHVRVGGRVYVLLDADEARPNHDHDTDQETSESEDRTAELIATLREQLQAERQAHAEARRLLAAALERIPAIEAPLGASETPDEQQGRGEPHSDAPGAPEAEQRLRWRRLFGG